MIPQNKAKFFAGTTFTAALLYFTILIGHNFILDPWQLLHKPWLRETIFIRNARFQDAGLINNYPFDSIILGTSMAENFSAKEASKLWDARFINLSVSGSYYSERSLVLKRALAKKDIKNVLYTLDFYPHTGVGSFQRKFPVKQFSFLYNQNRIDDLSIYLNWDFFTCWNLKNSCKKLLPGTRRPELDTLYEWSTIPKYVRRFGGLEKWLAAKNDFQMQAAFKLILTGADKIQNKKIPRFTVAKKTQYQKNLQESFIFYIVQEAETHPDTQFYLFFPPFSRIRYAVWQQSNPDYFKLYTRYIHFVADTAQQYDNIYVFGFDALDFPDDIANYKDTKHYGTNIDTKILQWMKNRQHELTEKNIADYIETITRKAQQYDLLRLARTIKAGTTNHSNAPHPES